MTLAEDLLEIAKSKGIVVATAESCTGGLVAGAITDVPGSSAILDRGFVTYTNDAKKELLDVLDPTIDEHGAVSEQVASEMAQGALQASKANIAVSVTGIAGPGGSEFKPEGRVCFGVATPDAVDTETVEFGAIGRAEVREASVDKALTLLIKAARAAG
ncbi:nicotinamide-nucleotide amidase [Cognatiyoonia sediminum]|uniref:Nicotinamide-nucleotide amidase n=1 Tax=Cognatiyoonia sediminum TaxID=1508389 RepID=A0A1M5M3X9_9RHOB|nr:CinA family protein [Cognatiyoonia sediminum]SHG71413.1 nicotinamide-nucleotide amidase [Cognatiyoonia sediminum]